MAKYKTAGHPLKFQSLKKLQKLIDEYFDITKAEEVTITGLALHLDTSRKVLMTYERKEKYGNTIKRAKTKVEHEYEKSLRKNGRAGDIFGLKNFGWRDEQVVKKTFELDKEKIKNMSEAEKLEALKKLII